MCCGEGMGETVIVATAIVWTVGAFNSAFRLGEPEALWGPAVLWLLILVWVAWAGSHRG